MPECRKKHGLLPSFLVILSILIFSLYSLQEVAITKLQGEYTVDHVKSFNWGDTLTEYRFIVKFCNKIGFWSRNILFMDTAIGGRCGKG